MATIKIHNVATGEIIEREMNAQELQQCQADKARSEAESEAQAQKAAIRLALLERLGISEEEAKILLS